MEINPAQQTQWCDKNVVKSQLRTTNTQNCCDVDGTTSKLQCCSNVVSKLHSEFNSQYTITDIVMTTQWTHLRRFTIDAASKFHIETLSIFHRS